MIRNFLINILFSIPVWLIELVYKFNKDVKRGFIFDSQSRMLLALMPKLDLHKIEDDEIPKIRNLINEKRKNLRLSNKTKKNVITKDHFIDQENNILSTLCYFLGR